MSIPTIKDIISLSSQQSTICFLLLYYIISSPSRVVSLNVSSLSSRTLSVKYSKQFSHCPPRLTVSFLLTLFMHVQSHIMPLFENVYTHFHHTIKMQGFIYYHLFHVTFIKNKDLLQFTFCFKYDFISRHMMDSPSLNFHKKSKVKNTSLTSMSLVDTPKVSM